MAKKKVKSKTKGFRDGMDKKKLMKSMTKEDWERIEYQKKLEVAEPGTTTYKLLLQNDPLRRRMKKAKMVVEKRLRDIWNSKLRVDRINAQLESGKIHDELKPGIPMTVEELELEREYAQNVEDTLAQDLVTDINEVRVYVGHHDITKNMIMTEAEFNEYVEEVEEKLKKHGYSIFD